MSVTIIDHPLAQHYLSQLRDKGTQPEQFRRLANHLTTILVIEATRSLRQSDATVTTPLTECKTKVLGEGLVAVPILRAGLSMLEPVLHLFPDVKVGYVGLERDEETAIARSYYQKFPNLEGRLTLCLDPMLATGGSAAQAISDLKSKGAKAVAMVSVISAPEGVAYLQAEHPNVPIFTASVDECLNEKKYIVPGLGDFGDRLYGTM